MRYNTISQFAIAYNAAGRRGYAAAGNARGQGFDAENGGGISAYLPEHIFAIRKRTAATSGGHTHPVGAILRNVHGLFARRDR